MKKLIKKMGISIGIVSTALMGTVYATDEVTAKINDMQKTVMNWLLEIFKAIAPVAIVLLLIGVVIVNDETASKRMKVGLVVIIICFVLAQVAEPIITSLS